MRFVRSIPGVFAFAVIAASVACGSADHDPTASDESQLNNGGLGATGDSCTIDLPDGLKKPGKENGKGQCCSVWDDTDCHDIPKSTIGGINRVGGNQGIGARR